MSKIEWLLRQGSKITTKLFCSNTWARKAPGLKYSTNGEPKISFPAKINATYKKHRRDATQRQESLQNIFYKASPEDSMGEI